MRFSCADCNKDVGVSFFSSFLYLLKTDIGAEGEVKSVISAYMSILLLLQSSRLAIHQLIRHRSTSVEILLQCVLSREPKCKESLSQALHEEVPRWCRSSWT